MIYMNWGIVSNKSTKIGNKHTDNYNTLLAFFRTV